MDLSCIPISEKLALDEFLKPAGISCDSAMPIDFSFSDDVYFGLKIEDNHVTEVQVVGDYPTLISIHKCVKDLPELKKFYLSDKWYITHHLK